MFMARHERSARHLSARTASGRKALRHSTLERRYDFHLSESIRAALQGSHDKAAGHSAQALLISRELCADAADPDEVNGVTLPDQKKIVINPNAPDFDKTVVHELVHAATDADGDSKDEEGKADVIGYRVAERITGQAPPFLAFNSAQEEQAIYNNKVDNPAYASLAASNGVDNTLSSLGLSAFSA